MSLNYTQELELLVRETLLPVYQRYQLSIGNLEPFKDINSELLTQIRKKKPLAALLKPYEPITKYTLVFPS